MEMKKAFLIVSLIMFLTGSVLAGSSYYTNISSNTDWSNGYNINNTLVDGENLSNPRNVIEYNSSDTPGWNSYSQADGFSVDSSGIIQGEETGFSSSNFRDTQEFDDYIGGIFEGDLVGEQSVYTYNGGQEDFVGSGLRYDVPAEGVTNGYSRYFSIDYDSNEDDSYTVVCNGNEHTWEWGYEDSSTGYVMIDGVKETINEDNSLRYGDHSAYPDSDCGDAFDDQEVVVSTVISNSIAWKVGDSGDDVLHIDDDKLNINVEPIHERTLDPTGATVQNVSISTTDPDVVSMFNPYNVGSTSTGFVVDGGGSNDNNLYSYQLDNDGSSTQTCTFSGDIAPNSKHTLASVKGDLSFGDASNDLISVNDANDFTLIDPASTQGDNCNTKALSNPTSGDLTGVSSDIRDVDDDGNNELVFTVAGSGAGADANGYIHHADFSIDGLTDIQNTSVKTHEGDVGTLSDWDADNIAEIPYRDVNSDVKILDKNTGLSENGDYRSTTQSSDWNEPLFLTTWYETPQDGVLDADHIPSSNAGGCGQHDLPENSGFGEPDKVDYLFCGFTVDSFQVKYNYSGIGDNTEEVEVLNYTFRGESYPRSAEWNSSVLEASVNDPTPDEMKPYAAPKNLSKDLYAEGASGIPNASNVSLKVASYSEGFWTSFYSADNLDQVTPGTKFVVKAVFDRNNSDIGRDFDLKSSSLRYQYSPFPENAQVLNQSLDVGYVQAGFDGEFRVNETDSDGVEDVDRTNVTLTMPDGSTKSSSNINSNLVSSSSSGDRVSYSFSPSADPSNLGEGSYEVYMEDVNGNSFTKTGSFFVNDTFKPNYRSLTQEKNSVEEGTKNTLSVDVKDKVEVDKVEFYADTGSGFSKVGTKDVSIGDSFTQVTYDYDTSGLSDGDSVDWKAKVIDTESNTKETSVKSFSVVGVALIDNVTLDYRNVGGTLDKEIRLDLDDEYNISSRNSVSGADTIEFTNQTWRLENFTLPFSSDLNVTNSNGATSRHLADFDVSVKNIRGHDENSTPVYQEKNKTVEVDNSGGSFYLNVSCANNGFGDPVGSTTDTVKQMLSDRVSRHACKWSGDWITENYKDADPSVNSVNIDKTLKADRDVNLSNNQSVDFPSINVSGYAEPDNTCKTSSNSILNVSANGFNTENVGFDCDIGDSGSPQTNIDGSDYNHTTVLNVSSDLAENISISWSEDKSNIQDWSSKDDGSAVAYVKGTSDSILLVESSDSVEVRVPDDAFSSSLHEGQSQASISYTVGDTSDDGGGSAGGGGGSSDPIIVTENVTGEFNWSVSAPRSRGQQFFNIVGWPGRDLGNAPSRVVARNLGDNNFSLSVKCVSNDDSCEFIELSDDNITLDTLNNRENVVEVEGVVPEEIPDDGYRFNIVFEDPEGKTIDTNFRINKNFAQSLIIRFISKLTGVEEYDLDGDGGGDPIPIPYFVPVFLSSLIIWGLMALATRFAQSNRIIEKDMDFVRGRLILVLIYFILAFIFI